MALLDTAFYVDSVGYAAVTAWATGATIAAGALRRQNATPAQYSERVFIAIVAGTTHATTEPTWVTTRGAKTTDNTVTWMECTGVAAVNGDVTDTANWTAYKAATASATLGQIIQNNAATFLFICTTAGAMGGSQPSFNTTTGATTADSSAVWTCIGAISAFAGNAAPHASLNAAFGSNWAVTGGNLVYVKSSHAHSSVNGLGTISSATGSYSTPIKILCHDGGAYPPASGNLTTGAKETGTGSSTSVNLNGLLYVEGLEIEVSGTGSPGINIAAGNNNQVRSKNLKLTCSGNTTSATISLGFTGSSTTYQAHENLTCSFANASQAIRAAGMVDIRNLILAGTTPTGLFTSSGVGFPIVVDVLGSDISALGSGKTLVPATMNGKVRFINCKVGASVTVLAAPSSANTNKTTVDLINCDSGAVNYRNERHTYEGDLTTETTIVRTGGASDGTTGVSWKVVTNANPQFTDPFECPPILIWNETTGAAITLTIDGVWGGGAVPNNDEAWIEVEYLGASSSPISSTISSAKANVLASGAAVSAGSGTWGGSTTKFALAVTFTPQMKGLIAVRVKLAKVSSTFYIDPKVQISGVTVAKTYMQRDGYTNELQAANSNYPASRIATGM